MKDLLAKIGVYFMDTLETIVVALAIFVICYLFLFQVHEIKGASMDPNFHDSERILTDKITYRLRKPARGEVIIFRAPKDRELDYVKRIIGLPGEKIMINGGSIYLNDQKLKETYLPEKITNSGAFLKLNQDFLIPEDEYVVLGDNRNHSSDSREWGTVNKDDIIGKVLLRFWPATNFSFISKTKYN